MKTLFTIFAVVLCVVLLGATAWGANRYSVATGAWASTSTWSATSGGASGASFPVAGDNATIEGGFTVTLGAAAASANVTVKNASTLDASTFALTVSATFTLEGGSTFKQGGTITAAPGTTRSFANTSTYIFNGTQTSITSYFTFGNLTWSAGSSTPGGNLQVNGDLTITAGNLRGSTGTGTPTRTHTVNGNVVIDGASTYLAGTNATAAGTGTWNILGNVTTQNSGTLRGCNTSSSANGTINIGGNLINNGTVEHGTGSGTFTLTFNGSSTQSTSGNAITTLQDVTISNTSGIVTFNNAITSTGTFTVNSSASLALGATYTDNGTMAVNGTLNCGTNPVSGTGTFTLASGATLIMASVDGITSTASTGNIQVTSTRTYNTGANYTYNNGSSAQVTGNQLPSTVNNLTIDNGSSSGITLTNSATVSNVLALTNGKVTTSSNTLTVGTSGSVSRTNGYVVGNLAMNFGTGNLSATKFHVGTSSAYTPVEIDIDGTGGTAGTITATTTGSAHSQIATSGLDVNNDIERFWTLTPGTAQLGGRTYKLKAEFLTGDVGGANPSNFEFREYSASAWSTPTGGSYTRTGTTTQYDNFTSFSDFAVGEPASSNSNSSDIIANVSFTYPTDIDYASNTGTNVTSSNPEVFEFDIRDGGGSSDADALSTTLTAITFSVSNSSVLEKVALYDGTSELAEVTASSSITFSSLSSVAADNSSKTLNLRATYKTTVTDNTQFSFTVTSATADPSGSTFAAGNAGGATSSTSGTNNQIEVTATKYSFSTQPPSTTTVNTNFSAGVEALDANNNRDLDDATLVTLAASAGALSSATGLGQNLSSGVYNWTDLQNNTAGTGVSLSATGTHTTANSNTMTILSAQPTIQASNVGFSNVLTNSMDVSWTNGNGNKRIVIAKEGSAPTFTPSDGSTYSYNSNFSSAPTEGDAKVVYIGTSNTFPLSGLSENTTYHVAVFEFNNPAGTENYLTTSPATGNQLTAASVSLLSDIVAAGNETANIDYASYQNGSITTTSDGVRLWSFTIRDGGGSADADPYGTEMTSVTIDQGGSNSIANWSNVIRQATLFQGTTKVADATTIGSTSIAFTGLSGTNVTAADDDSKTLSLYVTFKTTVTDNEQFQFQITNGNVTAAGSNSSLFTTFSAQTSGIGSDANKIEVTATKLNFSTQPPTTTTVNTNFSAGVEALDANNNRDLDATTSVTLGASAGTLSSTTGLTQSLSSGVYDWTDLQNNTAGTGVTLSTTNLGSLTNATSNSMTIYATEPGTQASVVSFSSVGSTSMTVNWTGGSGDSCIVLAKLGGAVDSDPVDGTLYTANSTFAGAGASQLGTGNYVVYIGRVNSVAVSGLTANTTYHFAVYEFNGASGVENYRLSPARGNQQTTGETYTWNQTGSASWAVTTNWTPTRTTPATGDILQFNGGGTVTVTSVPTQTIARLILSNSSTVNLQASGANTLTIGGGAGTDLDVPAGSALNVDGTNALTTILSSGATGSISGSMTYSNGVHKLNAADASAITFSSGATMTQASGCTGNIFTNAGTANVITFASGSTFISQIGSNPFGLGQPSSKVVFQTGSLYSHQQTGTPSFSGRTYANFELNMTGASISGTGGSALSIDNLTITDGTLSMGMTGTFNLKGNISIASGKSLTFSPLTTASVTLNGSTSQTISGSGSLTFASTQNVTLNNSAGLALQKNVTINGALTLQSGNITTGSDTLSVLGAVSRTSGHVVGNLGMSFATGELSATAFHIGTASAYTPATLDIDGSGGTAGTIIATTTGSAHSDIGNSRLDVAKDIERYWTISPGTAALGGRTYKLKVEFLSGDVGSADPNNFEFRKYSSGTWAKPTGGTYTRTSTSTQYDNFTSFSSFSVGEPLPNEAPVASSVNITGTAAVGQLLTGHYTYSDVDGDLEGTSTFRWLRNGGVIGSATASTYTVVLADLGQPITFEVTPVALTGASPGTAVASSGVTILNSAPTASSVNITGTPKVGQLLTGNYSYNDVDEDVEGTSTFRWLRNGGAIGGATASTYTVVLADLGQPITFEVTPVALTGTSPGTAVTSSGVTILNSAPVASSVNITGTLAVGQLLTGHYTYSDVDGDLEGTSTFRWLRNGGAIGGATASTYTVVLADLGQPITFEVTPVALTGASPGTAVTSSGVTILNSAPTASSVNITGTPKVGELLTGNYTYNDVDGDLEGTSTFRWLRNGGAIGGATASTYTVVLADLGQPITFEVTPVAATGTSPGTAVTSSGVTILNSAPVASSVNITGTPKVGQLLTGHYTYNDVDGDLEGTSTFRWLRNGGAIGGATASTYTVVLADLAQPITFEVTPVAATGTTPGTAVTSSGVTILNSAPTASSVNITGTPKVGELLTGHYTYSDVDGDIEGTSTFRWLRNGGAIGGATASTYTVVLADLGQPITFEVTPVAATGTTPGTAVTSSGVTILNSAPIASSVNITGTPSVGQLLTGHYTYSDVDGDLEGTSTFRWLRNGGAIGGATASTYTVVLADLGQPITFEVTPVAATGTSPGTAVTSSGVVIGNSAPTASSVNITGTPKVGQLLTGHYTYSDVDGDLEGTSTFRWLRNGGAIGGATASTYTVVLADLGQPITFEVTPVAATGTSPGTAVTSSGVTILNSAPVASSVNITGTPKVGQLLTGHYTYSDVDGDLQGTSTFRWLRNGGAIGGATASTYTVVLADLGQPITFEVTPVAATGTSPGTAVTSSEVTILNSAPTATSVNITGVADVGHILTGHYTYNDVDGDLEGTSTFRWLRGGLAIDGATASTYTVVSDDRGLLITFEVTPVALTGTSPGTPVTSSPVEITSWPTDAKPLSVDYPTTGGVPQGGTLAKTTSGFYPKVTVRNNGTLTKTIRTHLIIKGATVEYDYLATATDVPPLTNVQVTFTDAWDASGAIGQKTVTLITQMYGDQNMLNDTIVTSTRIVKKVTDIPYSTTFEDGKEADYFGTGDWVLGTPAKTYLSGTASVANAWVTKLTGNYTNGQTSYLYTPYFDFAGIPSPLFKFKNKFWFDNRIDDGVVEYTLDYGATWLRLGGYDDPNGQYWYNWNGDSLVSGKPAWTFRSDSSFGSSNYVSSQLHASSVGNSVVQFRFVMQADGNTNREGWAVDDFGIAKSASISGTVYRDGDGSAVKDGQPKLVGVKVYYNATDFVTTVTGGAYTITGLAAGVYDVHAVHSGSPTQPIGGHYSVTVIDNDAATDKDFGFFEPARIRGLVYWDVNHNGLKDGPDSGVGGVKVRAICTSGPPTIASKKGLGIYSTNGVYPTDFTGASYGTPSEFEWNFGGGTGNTPCGLDSLYAGTFEVSMDPTTIPTGFVAEIPGKVYTISPTWGDSVWNLDFVLVAMKSNLSFRTAKYEEWALCLDDHGVVNKAVKRQPHQCDVDFLVTAPFNCSHVLIKKFAEGGLFIGTIQVNSDPVIDIVAPGSASYDIATPVAVGSTIHIQGYTKKDKAKKMEIWWYGTAAPLWKHKYNPADFIVNKPRLPMPNFHNVGEELFPKNPVELTAYFSTANPLWVGMVTSGKNPQTVALVKYNDDVKKSMLKAPALIHTGTPACFTPGPLFTSKRSTLAPDKFSFQAFGELLTAKLNVAASLNDHFPVGLGELTFNNEAEPLNLFNGMTVNQIIADADKIISCHAPDPPRDVATIGDVYTVLRMIDEAFSGAVDSIWFWRPYTKMTGVKPLADVAYLYAAPGYAPQKNVLTAGPVEPWSYSLEQNYPNPFNPTTTIQFTLNKPGYVTLKVYNMLGQEVMTLLENVYTEEGLSEQDFDASSLASGIYFYRLTVQSVNDEGVATGQAFTQVKKMTLVK